MVRDWARSDKAALLRHANNRKVWRNLTRDVVLYGLVRPHGG